MKIAYILKDLYSNEYLSNIFQPLVNPVLELDKEASMAWQFDDMFDDDMSEFLELAEKGYYLIEVKTIIIKGD